ncbi:DUF4331 family protein [Micromonospora sp.]|uniref:DUF4331 family protein n=1 Tax=unclassified Micromonospora TaxID=2617518 RepID=UPI003B3AA2A5
MSYFTDKPLAPQNGQLCIDDLYVFDGERGTVLMMNVNSSAVRPDTERGFHPGARYEFKIHHETDKIEGLTYRVAFGDPDQGGRQSVTLHALRNSDASTDSAAGILVVAGRTGEVVSGDGIRLWTGRIMDPFFIDLDQLTTVNEALRDGTRLDWDAWHPDEARNSCAGSIVECIVLEVIRNEPVLRDGARVRIWCTTKVAAEGGQWRPVTRAGQPMMWPIFWPTDADFTNPANARHPRDDVRNASSEIAAKVARFVAANRTAADPESYGRSVAELILPDMLSYRVGSPASFGFAVRNGRALRDNAPEVMFSLVLNKAITSGLTAETAEGTRSTSFPYVVPA